MGSLLGLFTGNFKVYAIAAVVAILVIIVGTFSWKYKTALDTIQQIQEQNITLEKEKAVLSKVNKENQTFINNMQADFEKKEKIVNDFRIQKARDNKKLSELSRIVSSYGENEDGPISKVLKDSVQGVIDSREGANVK